MAANRRSAEPIIGPQTPVTSLMTRAVARISPDARLREVAQKLSSVGAGALAVGTTSAVVGVVSERDVTRSYGRTDQPDTVKAADIASTEIIWCAPDTTAEAAARTMCERGVRHLLVGDGEAAGLQGIVSARDLIDALVSG
ncbi:MAG: CBS domain-containing protein [Acidimicrobiales bacterium]